MGVEEELVQNIHVRCEKKNGQKAQKLITGMSKPYELTHFVTRNNDPTYRNTPFVIVFYIIS